MTKSIHPESRPGFVDLKVASLDRQIEFYRSILGFRLHWHKENQAGLGANEADIVRLSEYPDYKRYRGVTGLYHFAILFPDRRELARAVARLFAARYPNYPTDHIMTKTTYLDDPEGNGIELYTESPEDGSWYMQEGEFITRRTDGTLSNGREPLDLDDLFSYLEPDDRMDEHLPEGTRIGHIHLHVRNIDEAVDFYHGVIGFDVMGVARTFRMAFVSAGGYHHHVGLNTWQGEGAPPPPEDALGLRYFSIELPEQDALDEVMTRVKNAGITVTQSDVGFLVSDPSHNRVLLSVSPSGAAQ